MWQEDFGFDADALFAPPAVQLVPPAVRVNVGVESFEATAQHEQTFVKRAATFTKGEKRTKVTKRFSWFRLHSELKMIKGSVSLMRGCFVS